MAKPYKEDSGWCLRKRHKGHDIYLLGYPSKVAVERASREHLLDIDQRGKPASFFKKIKK